MCGGWSVNILKVSQVFFSLFFLLRFLQTSTWGDLCSFFSGGTYFSPSFQVSPPSCGSLAVWHEVGGVWTSQVSQVS